MDVEPIFKHDVKILERVTKSKFKPKELIEDAMIIGSMILFLVWAAHAIWTFFQH